MPKVEIQCEACGATFYRYPSGVYPHKFCSRECARTFTSARMREYNRTENPMNTPAGWTDKKRNAVRERKRKEAMGHGSY